ncbi:MAG: hypothetical protein HY343_06050 [Lentisphaerae bacterium]|nr:hypothetical protein [Lentisphaerota bacterium]
MKINGWAMGLAAAVLAMAGAQGRAQDDDNDVSASVDATLASAYVFRGTVLNDEPVLQPAMTISKAGFSLNVWNNLNLTDGVTAEAGEFYETDLKLSYEKTLCDWIVLSGGIVQYLYPHNGESEDITTPSGDSVEIPVATVSSREVFASVGLEWILKPKIEAYYDIDEINGGYIQGSVEHTEDLIEDRLSATLQFSSGYADKASNEGNFGIEQDDWNDGAASLSAEWVVLDGLTLTPSFQYAWLWKQEFRDAAEIVYYNDGNPWVASIALAYEF